MTCWHRPTHSQIKLAKDIFGITMIITIGIKKELPDEITKSCNTFDIKHKIFELESANLDSLKDIEAIKTRFKADLKDLYKFLENNEEKILIHCACGI